jgi:hypothetical protein
VRRARSNFTSRVRAAGDAARQKQSGGILKAASDAKSGAAASTSESRSRRATKYAAWDEFKKKSRK